VKGVACFSVRCPQGHEHGPFYSYDEAERIKLAIESESFCGPGRYSVLFSERAACPSVIPDLHEHYNASLGTVVRGRAHLKQLQHDLGCQDYEPTPSMQEKLNLSRDKLRHAEGRGRVTVGV
jgi:hypothetical protein